jgi:hypothetical protein
MGRGTESSKRQTYLQTSSYTVIVRQGRGESSSAIACLAVYIKQMTCTSPDTSSPSRPAAKTYAIVAYHRASLAEGHTYSIPRDRKIVSCS